MENKSVHLSLLPDYETISRRILRCLPEFQRNVAEIPYEVKGILYSEILFLLSCADIGDNRVRILESGRARGQSTLLLAKALPQNKIISIEFDGKSPDTAVAEARLKDCKNVVLEYGDSRTILPKIGSMTDIILIDGPKMFEAIRLSLRLLSRRKAAMIFVHDIKVATPEREFLNRFLPECRFSDKRELAQISRVVDTGIAYLPPPFTSFQEMSGEYGYGFTLVCIPFYQRRNYRVLCLISYLYDALSRIKRKII